MIVHEEFYLDIPHAEAWQFFSDIPSPLQALPGLFELVEYKPHKYRGKVRVHIGPFPFTFSGNIEITLVDHAEYRVNIKGFASDGRLKSSFGATAHTQTLPHGSDNTRVILEVQVGLEGIIAKLSEFVLRPKARQVVGYYRDAVRAQILKRRKASAETVKQ